MLHSQFKLLSFLKFCVAALFLSLAPSALAFDLQVGPVIGGGRSNQDQSVIQHASGMSVSAMPFTWKSDFFFDVTPVVGAHYLLINTRKFTDNANSTATYDHRLGTLGAKVSMPLDDQPLSARAYAAMSMGIGQGKLDTYNASQSSFTQRSFGGLRSDVFATEAGAEIPLKENFAFVVGSKIMRINVDQTALVGSEKSEENSGSRLTLTSKSSTSEAAGLNPSIRQVVWMFNFGAAMTL